jgi:Domain of unknown function (DUF4132)
MVRSARRPANLEALLESHHRRGDGLLIEFGLLENASRRAPMDDNDHIRAMLQGVARITTGAPGDRRREWLEALDVFDAASLAVVAAEDLATKAASFTPSRTCTDALRQMVPRLTADDIRLLLSFDDEPNFAHYARVSVISLALASLERLLTEEPNEAHLVAEEAADRLTAWNPDPFVNLDRPEWRPYVWQLWDWALRLTGRPAKPYPGKEGPIFLVDGFSLAAVQLLGEDTANWPPGFSAVLEHCARARANRPSAKWLRSCNHVTERTDGVGMLVEELLKLVATAPAVEFMTDHGSHSRLLQGGQHGGNDDLVRGLVWTAGLLKEPWTVDVLELVAARCLRESKGRSVRRTAVTGEKVPNACFMVLTDLGTDEALAALRRLSDGTTNRTVLTQVGAGLRTMAERRGVSVEDLYETSLPDFGLDIEGETSVELDGATARLRLDDRIGCVVRWIVDGGESSRAPQVTAPVADQVRKRKAELAKAARSERARLEQLFTSGREWPVEEFYERYVTHPLTGWFARRLFWVVQPVVGDLFVGLPGATSRAFVTPDGQKVVEGEGLVQIWHPANFPEVTSALREMSINRHLAQPFRQAWRETYEVGDSETSDEYSSNRFAGHVLHFHQFYAVARERGWHGGFISGAWDGGQAGTASRDFLASGLRANWALAAFDLSDHRIGVRLAVTDLATFVPIGDERSMPVPLREVPKVVFSETMRDLDLFTAKATVATDPFWVEKFANVHVLEAYWRSVSDHSMPEGVRRRREVLELILAASSNAGRFELGERQLTVYGRSRRYVIQLGTANVRMEPPGRWLSFNERIDRAWRERNPVPSAVATVEDDPVLVKIVARAQMLAEDHRISTPDIRDQLRDRGTVGPKEPAE